MAYPVQYPAHWKPFVVRVTDVSTASSTWVHPGINGKIKHVSSVIDGAIATAPSVLTFEIGGVAVTGLTVTITHTSSAAGDVDTATATALNSFTSDQPIEVVCSGASTDTAIAEVTIWVEPN
jgi:hypothetical protein